MIWALKNWKLALLITLGFLLGFLGVRSAWLSSRLEKAENRARELKGYQKGRKEADHVDEIVGDDPAAAREFLRSRKP